MSKLKVNVLESIDGTFQVDVKDISSGLPNILKYGAVGDGVADDTTAFSDLEAAYSNIQVELYGKTYLVEDFPIGNQYVNGRFKRVSDGLVVQTEYSGTIRVGNSNTILGRLTTQNLTPYSIYKAGPRGYNLTAVGDKAMGSAGDGTYNCSAFGVGALFSNQYARYNDAFGLEALYYTNGIAGDGTTGTRNSAFGANALRFNTTGRSNVAMGRNANHTATTANENVFLGAGSGAGAGPLDLSGAIINPFPRTASRQTAVGTSSLFWSNGVDNCALGWSAGLNVKLGTQNVAIGSNALALLESGVSPEGNGIVVSALDGTWSQSGTTLSFNMAGHGMSVGFKVVVSMTTGAPNTGGDSQYFTIISTPDADTWTAAAPDSATRSGTCSRISYYNLTPVTASSANTAVGNNAMGSATSGSNNTAHGAFALRDNQTSFNTAVGALAGLALTSGTQNTAMGYSALRSSLTGGQNTANGEFSLGNLINGSGNSAFGRSSLRAMQDGSPATTLNNCSALGHNASVSADNQIQLGNSATTTYVYGTVQNRSDARDKADVKDTSLGLDFINGLRSVEGRWDLREDYYEEVEVLIPVTQTRTSGVTDEQGNLVTYEETVYEPTIELKQREKDGSKKRQRLHQWFIAQEVKELCDKLGVDFGGLQDHSITGGCDVMSLGYDEFIPPIVKAIQEISQKQKDIEARLEALENL